MASSGGGKIKNKRSRGAKTPYQRPKSLLSHVTETVTGLVVPTWLKSMWNRNEEDDDVTSEPASPEFDPDVPSTSFGTGHQPSRRRHSDLEANTAPARSFRRRDDQETEGGVPPKKNTPLPFTSYTKPIQTSTPVENEFMPPRREVQAEARDDDTDSSVSTSGCSSLLPHVDRADHKEKLAKSNLDQLSEWGQSSISTPSRMSLWSETNTFEASQAHRGSLQTESVPQPAAKRPRFNASYFGTPRQNTTLTPSERQQSSFYRGRTTFGGSSFYRSPAARRKHNPSPYQVHLPVKRHIRPKPAVPQSTVDPDFGVTSNTAMKILNTLDRMSTPLSDAKRIPLMPTPSPFAFKPRRVAVSERQRPVGPPVSGLQVGEKAKVIPNTQPPLPKYPVSNRLVSESVASVSPSPSVSITHQSTSSNPHRTPVVAPPAKSRPHGAPLPQVTPPKSGGKMKSKSKNPLHYSASRDDEDEVVEVPDLPNIALPIGQKPMPTFSFGNLQSKPSTAVAASPAFGGATNGGSSHPPGPSFGQKKAPTMTTSQSRAPWQQDGKTPSFSDGPSVPPKSSSTDSTSRVSPLMTSTPLTGSTAASQFKFTPANPKPIDGVGGDFRFSEPVVKVSTVGSDALPTTAADEEFTFSVPNQKDATATDGRDVASSFSKPSPSKDQNEDTVEDDSSGGIKVAKSLKSGSCLQVLGIGSSNPVTKPEAQKNTTVKTSSSLFDKFKPDVGSWECDTCLLRNGKDSVKCVACQSNKPVSNSKDLLQSSTGFSPMDKFKPPAGSWECQTCLIRNNQNVVKCAACGSAKPVEKGSQSTKPAKDDVTVLLSEKFKPPKGSWECDTCLIQNNATASSCAACQSKRPGTAGESDSQPESSSGATGGMSLSEMFKPPEGSWTCDTCLVPNQATDSNCLACQSSKPGASSTKPGTKGFSIEGGAFKISTPLSFGSKSTEDNKSDASAKPSLSEMFKLEEGSWECDTCMVRNKSSCGRCVACDTPKPGSELPLGAPPASSFKFGSTSTSSSSSVSATSSQGFKITGGIPSLLSSSTSSGTTFGNGGFTFGTGGNTPKDSSAPGAGFKLPGGIKFGSFTNTSKEQLSRATSSDAVSSSAGFSVESVSDKGTSGGLQPFKSSEGSAKVADSSATLSSGFKFGETSDESKAKKSTTFTFGASSTTDETDKLPPVGAAGSLSGLGDLKGTEQSIVKAAAETVSKSSGPVLQFGLKPNQASQSSSSSSDNTQATPNVNPFQSSLASAGSKPPFTFGAPSPSKSKPPSASITNPPPATKESSGSSFLVTTTAPPPAKSNAFQFGPTATKTQGSASILGKRKELEPSSTSTDKDAAFKPSFNFTGGSLSGPPVTFGRLSGSTQEQTPSMTFGASKPPSSTPQANASTFQFGAQPKTEAPAAQSSSLFAFGAKPQQSQVPASNASGFQFGTVSSSSSNSQQPEKKPFTFGAPATSTQSSSTSSFTASNSFTGFDSAGTAPTNSAIPFGGTTMGFGSNATSANSAFGAPSRQQNSTPVFGQGALQQNSFGATTNSAPSLGSVNAAPAFGTSVPAFGSNSQPNANSTGFSAGMEAPTFQFGQNNNNNPSTGTFAFGAGANPTTNTTQGRFSFNASQPPVFNFGAAAPASNQAPFQFSAAPTTEVNPFNASAPPSGRKFKKAVRRTGRKT